MIKAIIFDLNGVFIQSRYLSDRIKEDFGISEDEFLPALKEIAQKTYLPGAKNLFSYWQPYFKKWNINFSKEEWEKYWFEAEGGVMEMVAFAKELKAKGLKIFILSNNFKERSDYYQKAFPFLEEAINKIYYSWQTGFIKPDEKAYKLILDENSLQPEECLYFDDSSKNVEKANSLGIQAFQFESIEKLKKDIRKILERY